MPPTERKLNAWRVWSPIAAALLATFYLATNFYIASHRHLWFDELFTVHIARLPHWATIWQALAHGVDSQPPSYYMLIRTFDKVFGPTEIAVRLPSMLALFAGMLITFDCARRLTDSLHGLIALSILTCSLLPFYGYETRPYALYFMLSALALWIWCCTREDSKWSSFLFGAVLCLGVTMHYYAVLSVVPYAMWELSRWRPWRRPSQRLVAGFVGVALPPIALSPFAMGFSRHFSSGFRHRPSLHALVTFFPSTFPDGLFLLALAGIWVVLMKPIEEESIAQNMSTYESLGWLFLCIPVAGFVVAEIKTNAFAARFFLSLLPGVAVAFACWTWRNFRNVQRVALGIFLLLATWGLRTQVHTVRVWQSIESPGTTAYLRSEDSLASDGKRFFVLMDPLVFLEAQYYSKYPQNCVLLLPLDFQQAERLSPDPYMNQRLEVIMSHYYPLQIWRIDQLQEYARSGNAALINPKPDVLEAMKRAGFQIENRFPTPFEVVYLK